MGRQNEFSGRRHAGLGSLGHDGKVDGRLFYDIGPRGLFLPQREGGEPLVENWDKLPGLNANLALQAGGAGAPSAQEFLDYTAHNKSFELLGTGTPRCRFVGNGIEISTTDTDGDSAIIAPHLDVGTINAVASVPVTRWSCGRWKSQNQVRFLSRIRTQKIALITNASRSTTTASITTSLPHHLSIGQSVTIYMSSGPTGYAALQGTYTVTALTSTTVFTYTTATSGTVNSGTAVGTSTPNDLKLQTIWTGLKKTNTPVGTTDTNQFFMRYLPTEYNGQMQIWTSRGNVDVTTVLPVTVQPNTVYNILFDIDANRVPSVWVNGEFFNLKCGECGETGADGSAALVASTVAAAEVLIPYTGTSCNGTTPGTKAIDILSGYSIDAIDLIEAA